MPGYASAQYNVRQLANVGFAVDLGTATVSGANTLADAYVSLPKFIRRTKLTNVRLRCTGAPNAAATALKVNILNGTATAASITVTTATADQQLDATITAANAVFAADTQPTIEVTGTATASGGSVGDYDIWFETQELFA